jgi:hypothetical protein
MAETVDIVIRGGTRVNHDGRGVRDIGIRGGVMWEGDVLGPA